MDLARGCAKREPCIHFAAAKHTVLNLAMTYHDSATAAAVAARCHAAAGAAMRACMERHAWAATQRSGAPGARWGRHHRQWVANIVP